MEKKSSVSPWFETGCPPDPKLLTLRELVTEWSSSRNGPRGIVCADEICSRVKRELDSQPDQAR